MMQFWRKKHFQFLIRNMFVNDFTLLENGNAYFRVMNSGGNYLRANGSVLSDVSQQAFRNLTHFIFRLLI